MQTVRWGRHVPRTPVNLSGQEEAGRACSGPRWSPGLGGGYRRSWALTGGTRSPRILQRAVQRAVAVGLGQFQRVLSSDLGIGLHPWDLGIGLHEGLFDASKRSRKPFL